MIFQVITRPVPYMVNSLPSADRKIALEKKRLGAFYTPQELSDLMAIWAITRKTDKVLEPSFGGCGFLKSSADRLIHLGSPKSNLPLYGCDIDTNAFNYLAGTVGKLVDLSNFALGDFLTLENQSSWPNQFDVILGNPPYIPYQQIPLHSREVAIKQIQHSGYSINLRSSLWVYFVALSLKYLKAGGRIAWVLPGSFLQANYSHSLREFLALKFENIIAFQIKERLFLYEGTDETTVVLLGKDYKPSAKAGGTASDIPLVYCKSYKDIGQEIARWQSNKLSASSCASPILDSLSQEAQRTYNSLQCDTHCFSLGSFASIRIGLVTGANNFFVLDQNTAKSHGLSPKSLIPVLGKFSSVNGLSYSKANHARELNRGKRCLLVSSNYENPRSKKLAAYLNLFPKDKIETVSTFKKRKNWHKTHDNKIPDAFFPVMHHTGPQIALNVAKINCTNSIHRVYFHKGVNTKQRKLISISLLSSFSQLSAEIEGRKYGSGVLKHEPREAEKIKLLMPKNISSEDLSDTYKAIHQLVKNDDIDGARLCADQFILKSLEKENQEAIIKILSLALNKVRKLRHADRRKRN